MREFVGIDSFFNILGCDLHIKRDALIFHKVGVPLLGPLLHALKTANSKLPNTFSKLPFNTEAIREIEWFLEAGIIFEPQQQFDDARLAANPSFQDNAKDFLESGEAMKNFFEAGGAMAFAKMTRGMLRGRITSAEEIDSSLHGFFEQMLKLIETSNRLMAIQLRELDNIDAYPILNGNIKLDSEADKTNVIQLVLNSLPTPDESASWEQILDFRSDPDSYAKFLALRTWMNKVAKGNHTFIEIEQELEFLMSEYRQHMKLHKMKTNTGTITTYLKVGIEFLEELRQLKPSKAVEALFSLRHRRIALMEGELTSPGSEVAYVLKAQDTFTEQV
jgi:hypothetical protein